MTPFSFSSTLRPLETIAFTSPLGMRFWDVGRNLPVEGGLVVTATAPNGKVITGVENRSGVTVFVALPGVPREAPPGVTDYFSSPPPAVPFLIEVNDPLGRFLPVRFNVDAPVKGLFELTGGSPPDSPPGHVPLFSSPQRTPPAGSAVVRAELFDLDKDGPAAWALLEATAHSGAGPIVFRGLSDEKGRVAIFFPYPEFEDGAVESLPHAVRRLTDQQWPLDLNLRYEHSSSPPPNSDRIPPLLSSLLAQRPGTLLALEAGPAPLGSTALIFGQDVVLRSGGSPPPSSLFVRPFA